MTAPLSGRRWLACVAGASLLMSGLTGTVATASPAPEAPPQTPSAAHEPAEIDPEVQADLESDGRAAFWVHFNQQPDMGQFESIGDWDARGEAVFEALSETAESSQADVVAELTAQQVPFQSFYITNAIKVLDGDQELIDTLAAADGVDRLVASFEVEAPEQEAVDAVPTPSAVEWGVSDINADDVWSDYGVTGEGIVVANIDTGVQFDHPALAQHYRGNNGDGTYDHNYNWFDAAGTGDVPDDDNGHGTHTMGTMIGGDGGANQVGVAPGATWIAANGCCPSDAALIESMEWMLAPTDLNGENPDTSKRPHIVNNSWGTSLPSNDPFGEEIQEAWAAAGIFGVFSNGNEGSSCNTSGSPGSRILNYSVGNYTSEHVIAPSSSRGSGQDGEIKPNISAPGSNIRSTVPGNGYESYTGTSMAAPHVAGAAALLWSGAPALIGDIDATRALLDGSAIDTEDLQCGGTADKNNVFGEGRLDVLAALEAAPTGSTGTLTGTITDTETGEPIEGATVVVSGELERTVTTNDEGHYQALLVAGDYQLAVEAFGYASETDSVTLSVGEETVVDVDLEPLETVTVSGTVRDPGHGWPLYAVVRVQGATRQFFTDPATGAYSIEVPVGETYELTATAQYPGYHVATEEISVNEPTTVDFDVPVDAESCTAPGYQINTAPPAIDEHFDATEAPAGWEVTDELGSGNTWRFDNPGDRPNWTVEGEGNFAAANASALGEMATTLLTPSFDLSEAADPILTFNHYFNVLFEPGDVATVGISTDGAATWTTLATYTEENTMGPVRIPLTSLAGEPDVRLRFHFDDQDAVIPWMWQIDDVVVADQPCMPIDGGLVLGNVYDGNTGEGVLGAQVTNLGDESEQGITDSTPADRNLDDGFYWLFSAGSGERSFEVASRRYEPLVSPVTVVADDVVRADFTLGASQLSVAPGSIDTELLLGESSSQDVTISNSGTSAAAVTLQGLPGTFEILRADGSRMSQDAIAEAEGAPAISREVETSIADTSTADAVSSLDPETLATPTDEPWEEVGPARRPVMDNRVVNLDGHWFTIGGSTTDGNRLDEVSRYDHESMTWQVVAPLPQALSASAAGVIDGKIIVSGGWSDGGTTNATFSYDPDADAWTQVADAPFAVSGAGSGVAGDKLYVVAGCTTVECPPMSTGVAAYDPASDTWEELADYPVGVAFLSCGGFGSDLFCAGGNEGSTPTDAAYVYDARADVWAEVASAPVTVWGGNAAVANNTLILNGGSQSGTVSNATYAYDPFADEWSTLPNSNRAVYRGGAACGFVKVGGSLAGFTRLDVVELLPGFDSCGNDDQAVPWLTVSESEFTVPAGEEVTVQVTTDADVPQPGTYTAEIRVASDGPGTPLLVPVTMDVAPPLHWGKLMGAVQGQSCEEGSTTPLGGATVDLEPTSGDHPGWHLGTNAEGLYATWFDSRVGQTDVTAAHPGYRSQSESVTVPRRETVTQDFALLDAECTVDPEPIHPDVVRLSGTDRYATAAAISGLYEPGVDTVFVAAGADYPDALAAAARAGSIGAPVLLTQKGHLPSVSVAELSRLDPAHVIVLGGKSAISPKVVKAIESQLKDAEVERLDGKNRYETAAKIARQFETAEVVYVATGHNYPDALAGAARSGALDGPVLLVKTDQVPAATSTELQRLNPAQIRVLGGSGAISDDVVADLGEFGAVERIAGENRYETAVQISQDYETNATVFVASGENWPDALAGTARAGHAEAPVLLTKAATIPQTTWDELERLKPGTVYVLGGQEAITQEVTDRLATLE